MFFCLNYDFFFLLKYVFLYIKLHVFFINLIVFLDQITFSFFNKLHVFRGDQIKLFTSLFFPLSVASSGQRGGLLLLSQFYKRRATRGTDERLNVTSVEEDP